MDFDDLDEAIEKRVAEEGSLEGAAALLALGTRVDLLKNYEPTTFMPLMPRSADKLLGLADLPASAKKGLPKEPAVRDICIRAFVFTGEGESAEAYAKLLAGAPPSVEVVVHEWPGHGLRGQEPSCTSLDELVADALAAVQPVLKEHGRGGSLEGAPFVLIGGATGASLLVGLAAKLRWDMTLEPAAVVILDRAPPNMPLLSQYGQELLASKPVDFLAGYRPDLLARSPKELQTWLADLRLACEVRNAGFHVFSSEVLVLRAAESAKIDALGKDSTFTAATFTIEGSSEKLTVPVQASTRVGDVKKALAKVAGVPEKAVALCVQNGGGPKEQADTDRVEGSTVVKGLKSFRPAPYEWPHPVAIIGAGYNGLKVAMEYLREGRQNITLFDRNDRVGGHCWITAANKDSKLQTEFAAFHLWFGPEYVAAEQCGGPGVWPTGWDCWAKKDQVLKHFQYAAEEFGILPHCCFETNVSGLEIVEGKDLNSRHYKLTVDSVKKGEPKSFNFTCSLMYNFPGSMTRHRIVEYPGEADFGGKIGYGMSDDFCYEEGITGKNVAILGNGAFAVENARTCLEHAAAKVYIVTRRKNLASPRIPCWFVHQGPVPTPGRMVVKMFEPMYKLCGMGDPWSYWSVHASQDRMNVTIIQNSRFGIGDVTFLAVAYGKLEYIEDTLKRLTHHTLHLNGGRKLEDVVGIIKSLGLLGDFAVDRLHRQTEMRGMWCGGDWRRVLAIDATGMNAANFKTFSLGIAVHGTVKSMKFLHDFPEEYLRAEKAGLLQSLPVSRADEKLEKPAYVTDVKYAMSCGIMISAYCPLSDRLTAQDGTYFHHLYHRVHAFDKFLEECIADWDKYQKMFKEQGCTHEYIAYPYTKEMVKQYIREYNEALGVDTSIEGPNKEKDKELFAAVEQQEKEVALHETNQGINKLLHKTFEGDPSEVLRRKLAHEARDKLMFSSAGSAMDFDFKQVEEWEQWATTGKCTIEDVEADHFNIKDHPKAIERIFELCAKKQAPPPK